MAEMTAAECIAALHNNQYQKHIGNGEYDYIHPLTDAQAKGIAALIQQQAATITELQTEIEYQNKQIARLQKDLSKWQVKDGQNDV